MLTQRRLVKKRRRRKAKLQKITNEEEKTGELVSEVISEDSKITSFDSLSNEIFNELSVISSSNPMNIQQYNQLYNKFKNIETRLNHLEIVTSQNMSQEYIKFNQEYLKSQRFLKMNQNNTKIHVKQLNSAKLKLEEEIRQLKKKIEVINNRIESQQLKDKQLKETANKNLFHLNNRKIFENETMKDLKSQKTKCQNSLNESFNNLLKNCNKWNYNQIIKWLKTLQNKNNKMSNDFKELINKIDIIKPNGEMLLEWNKTTLKMIGIKNENFINYLLNEIKDLKCKINGKKTCGICYSNDPKYTIIPCGHSGICKACVDGILHRKICPFCNQNITNIIVLKMFDVSNND